jgi:hypothetical protein
MFELFFAQSFGFRGSLPKIGARRGSGSLLFWRWLTSARGKQSA